MKDFKRGFVFIMLLMVGFLPAHAQLNIDKVKTIFGTKKEPSKENNHIQQLVNMGRTKRFAGSDAEKKTVNYMSEQFKTLLFKPYLGQFIHRFAIDKKNNLSSDSYIKIFNQKLTVGSDIIIPPFSGTGQFAAQALPGMPEAENLWFIKFSSVGVELNNKMGNGLEKIYRKAKEAFKNGAESVMFVNDEGPTSDFTNSFIEEKVILSKPVFILNSAAYKKYIVTQGRGKEWINVDYDFSKTRRTTEGHNVIGYWQNQTPQNVIIAARIDDMQGKSDNSSGMAALLQVAERINQMRLKSFNYIVVGLSGTNDDRKGAESVIKKLRLSSSNVNCMIHIDDIGALNNKNEIFLSGVGTSPDWDMLLGSFKRSFLVNQIPSGEVGEENHRSFYAKGIPVLNVFTKRKNSRDKRLNRSGVSSIATSIGDLLLEIDNKPKLKFTKTQALPDTKKMNFKVSMGIIPDYAFGGTGLLIGNVRAQSPAAMSNVTPGDVLIKMEDYDIRNVNDYVRELAKYKKGDRLMIKVNRNGVDKKMLITFK